jgi:glycosyltransferase involved in cell wall biosynthesis
VFEGKRVGVVVPAYDEEALIGATLGGIPPLVDRIFVVNDGSSDATAERALGLGDPRVDVLTHEQRSGVGAATLTGYRRALADGLDVVVVMNGDNQMEPSDLPALVEPVARGDVDYAKANRLSTGQAWQLIPKTRFFGNAILSMLTKIASGYWHVADSQSGYTAVSRQMLEELDLDHIYTNYGFPNDMLVHLNVWNARVRDVPSRPIYGVGERSDLRYRHVVPRIAWLLLKGFFWRLWEKYVKRDFHPLVFFYVMGFIATVSGVLLGLVVVGYRIAGYSIPIATVVLVALLVISGLQFILFAMWFDMESNKDLR